MSLARPSLAPFCFGRAASFNSTGAFCKKCPFGQSCASNVMTTLNSVNEEINVVDLMKRTQTFLDRYGVERKAPIKPASKAKLRFATALKQVDYPPFVEQLPSKSRMLARALIKSGIDMRLDAKQGVNGFGDNFRPAYMRKVQDLLITGEFTSDELKSVISSETTLSQQALRNAASTVVSTMKELGFIKAYGNKYELAHQAITNPRRNSANS